MSRPTTARIPTARITIIFAVDPNSTDLWVSCSHSWFAGVPTFVKDMEALRGMPTRYGSQAVPQRLAAASARSVAQLLSTGLVPLGKSTTAEFGLNATTEPLHGPPTRNPRDRGRSSGGSSGGA